MKKVMLGLMVTFMSVGALAIGSQITAKSAGNRAYYYLKDLAKVEFAKEQIDYDQLSVILSKDTASFFIFSGVITGDDFKCKIDLLVKKSDGRVYENAPLKCQD